MDLQLQRFLDRVRPGARQPHLAAYEDLAQGLDAYLCTRQRSLSRLPTRDLHAFLGYWYLRQYRPLDPGRARRFCAAAQVLVRELTDTLPARRRRELRRETKRIAHAVTRAARASALLERMEPLRRSAMPAQVDDYCEIVARGGSHLVLRPLSSRTLLGPVPVPRELAATLDPGAFVNLRLGRDHGRWRILDYGFCYPPAARLALQELCAMGATS